MTPFPSSWVFVNRGVGQQAQIYIPAAANTAHVLETIQFVQTGSSASDNPTYGQIVATYLGTSLELCEFSTASGDPAYSEASASWNGSITFPAGAAVLIAATPTFSTAGLNQLLQVTGHDI